MNEATFPLPESVVQDTHLFRKEVEKYLSGETPFVAFRGIRVPMGIYEQREADTYMVRVRGAAGVFLPHQAKLIADLSETYGNGIVHVTTRQDLQIHGVRIEDTPTILERLLEVGLSSRGGGGNTVRNISACPLAGVCRDEVFDVTPYAIALTEYLIRERGNFNLPRKFKAAFSGCGQDCALCSVADLGFFAHERDGVRGFSVYAGGGMGAHSALGILLDEFVPGDAIFEVAEAVKRLFDKHGDRANRHKARLRFVVERMGAELFRRSYLDELEQVRRDGISFPEIRDEDASPEDASEAAPEVMDSLPAEWLAHHVIPQRQASRYTVAVRAHLGDVSAEDLRGLADAALSVGDGIIRTTQEQDIYLRGIPEEALSKAYMALRTLGGGFVSAPLIRCVACAGASTCKLGLCRSRDLAEAIDDALVDVSLPFEAVVRISGCPNSCGHHPIAALGLFGTASRVDGRLVPFYAVVAGGRLAEGNSALAQPIARVPAKAVPALLGDFWTASIAEFRDGEPLDDLIARWGIGYLRELAARYETVPSYDDAPDYYRDYGGATEFSLAGRGPGECGAGVTDVIALDIDEAKRALREGRLCDSIVASARALLVTRGLEPKKDREVFAAFSEHLIAPGWVARSARDLLDAAVDVKLGDRDSLDDLRDQVETLVKRIEELFLSLDSNLNFRVDPIDDRTADDDADAGQAATELDLRGVACPMNFVRAKIQLEQIAVGEVLDILLDDGEPARNVPASFAEQGQEVLSAVSEGNHHRVRVLRSS